MASTTAVVSSLTDLPSVGSAAAPAPSNELGKDAFLKLLTTQMQNQDPLNPVDNQQFIAQLAQFSSLEQLQNVGSKLDTLALAQASANQMATANLVGKDVMFKADKLGLVAGQPSTFKVAQSGASDDTSAVLTDGSGRVVRSLHLGARSGTYTVSWDGLDDQGSPLPSGEYVLSVAATRKDGTPVTADASVRGTVTGVTFDGQVPELVVAGRQIKLADVTEIATPASP